MIADIDNLYSQVCSCDSAWERIDAYDVKRRVKADGFGFENIDILGNSIYNKPLEWLYGNQLISNTSTVSYGGETIMNVAFKIVNEKGEVLSTIPYLGVAAFRAIEYVLIYAILLSLYGGITKRLERKL